jgi:hypothetical protein
MTAAGKLMGAIHEENGENDKNTIDSENGAGKG